MEKNIRFLIALACSVLSLGAYAQKSHWQCDPYAWQYDMTAYVTLTLNNTPVVSLSDYEIAAFCGNECRGVATVLTAGKDGLTATYGYLRIRSNRQAGDTITFKAYDRVSGREHDIADCFLVFQSQSVAGLPSSPVQLPVANITMGDVDGDGRITVNDAVLTIQATFGTEPEGFDRVAADPDGDGRVTINDAILIINQTF